MGIVKNTKMLDTTCIKFKTAQSITKVIRLRSIITKIFLFSHCLPFLDI